MFVLSNAWRALTRSKGRTALTAFITLAVTFGTVAGLAIIQEDTNAHTTTYDQQKATLAIRHQLVELHGYRNRAGPRER